MEVIPLIDGESGASFSISTSTSSLPAVEIRGNVSTDVPIVNVAIFIGITSASFVGYVVVAKVFDYLNRRLDLQQQRLHLDADFELRRLEIDRKEVQVKYSLQRALIDLEEKKLEIQFQSKNNPRNSHNENIRL